MRIAILKTQAKSKILSPNIRLIIPFVSLTPSELASPTLLNSNIKSNSDGGFQVGFNSNFKSCSTKLREVK